MSAEWSGRARFAPFAEALRIDTSDVMSARADPAPDGKSRVWTVTFTTDTDRYPDCPLWFARLLPDSSGILRVVSLSEVPGGARAAEERLKKLLAGV